MIAYIYRPKRQRNGKQVFNRIWRARLKLNGDAKARDISPKQPTTSAPHPSIPDAIKEKSAANIRKDIQLLVMLRFRSIVVLTRNQ